MEKDSKYSYWSDPSIKKNYKLLEELGKGSFGTVVKAKNRQTGAKVAIKLIKDINKSSYSLRKLLREIIILRKLSEIENNIFTIKLLDIIIPDFDFTTELETGNNLRKCKTDESAKLKKKESSISVSTSYEAIFLVMDFGQTDFKKMLNSVPDTLISEEHVKILLYNQLCSLKFLHSANLVHRDIKPANLLLDDQCRVMVCDFGLARSLPEKDELERSFKKIHQKAYEKIHIGPLEERKSRHQEFND
jgi:mitogen-activated protein kinase 1/3